LGPKKLRARLAAVSRQEQWPALSTIGDLLARKGLSARRKPAVRRGRVRPALAPNDIWCIDFKGWFRTGEGAVLSVDPNRRVQPLHPVLAQHLTRLCGVPARAAASVL
jgi:hypothetical protein